jgi:hypothetical protein
MRKWEKVMHNKVMVDETKEAKLSEMWDDGYWAEWARAEPDHEHDGEPDHYHHGHFHKH